MVWLDSLLVAAGLALVVAGAAGLVQGGSAVARRLGMSPLLVGLTIVSLGTTTPELLISVNAAWQGRPGVAVGTATGSVLVNLCVVLGISALAGAVVVRRATLHRDLPILAAATAGVWLLCRDGRLSRPDGVLLLLLVVPFLWHVYRQERKGWTEPATPPEGLDGKPLGLQLGAMLLGMLALAAGGRLAIIGAEGLISALAIPGRVIGATLLAVGTSLPELATAITAVRRRRADLAVGNVVGANVLDLLLVVGAAATTRPIEVVPDTWRIDLPVIFAAVALVAVLAASEMRLRRSEGALLLAGYVAYVAIVLVPAL